jgi:hypothetical protein
MCNSLALVGSDYRQHSRHAFKARLHLPRAQDIRRTKLHNRTVSHCKDMGIRGTGMHFYLYFLSRTLEDWQFELAPVCKDETASSAMLVTMAREKPRGWDAL